MTSRCRVPISPALPHRRACRSDAKPMKRRVRAAVQHRHQRGGAPEMAKPSSDKTVTSTRAMTKTAPRVGLALVLLLTIVLGGWPSPPRADGDPASDVLANQVLFLP